MGRRVRWASLACIAQFAAPFAMLAPALAKQPLACPRGMVQRLRRTGVVNRTDHRVNNTHTCQCPAGSYDWENGFIFCFDASKLYGGGDADERPATADDVAFRVTYGRRYDLVGGWGRYTVALPSGINSTANAPPGVSDHFAQCVGADKDLDEAQCWARAFWTRPFGSHSGNDLDDDWRYELDEDPEREFDIPGLMRLQNPESFSPQLYNPTCLPCPPCADCSREGTATIRKGWGLGTTQQSLYTGLLHGTNKVFKTLRNRPGSAALGPVATAKAASYGDQRNTRLQIQFVAARPHIATDHSIGCSYCPYDESAATEFVRMTNTEPDRSVSTWDMVIPIMFTLLISWWIAQLVSVCWTAGNCAAGFTIFIACIIFGVWYLLAMLAHDESVSILELWKAQHAAACPLQCRYTTNGMDAMTVHTTVPFHKTLFKCFGAHCPAEELYFDEGLLKLSACKQRLNDGDAWWCLNSTKSNGCVDAFNWSDSAGKSCHAYAHTFCNSSYYEKATNQSWSGTPASIAQLFRKERKQDISAFSSIIGSLSPIDACCACGGGGQQKEALQHCSHVVVYETNHADEETVLESRIVHKGNENPELRDAGQTGPMCAGCKPDWVLQKDGTCLKCQEQDAGGHMFILLVATVAAFVLNLRSTRIRFRNEAVNRAIRDLKAAEDSTHAPLFSNIGDRKRELVLDLMLAQTSKANAQFELDSQLKERESNNEHQTNNNIDNGGEQRSQVISSLEEMLAAIETIYRDHPALLARSGQNLVRSVFTMANIVEILNSSTGLMCACALLGAVCVTNIAVYQLYVLEWTVHPYLSVLVMPASVLLATEILQLLAQSIQGYTRYIQPMTKQYQKERQRMEKAATLVGGESAADVLCNAEQSLVDQIKIIVTTTQLATQLPFVLNFEFPPAFKAWLDALKVANLDIFGDFSGTCLIQEIWPNFRMLYMKFVVYMMLPPTIVLILAANYSMTKRRIVKQIQREIRQHDSSILHPPSSAVDALTVRVGKKNRSAVIRISNRTTCFLQLCQTEDASPGDDSSSPVTTSLGHDTPPGIEAGKWGRLEAAFGLVGTFPGNEMAPMLATSSTPMEVAAAATTVPADQSEPEPDSILVSGGGTPKTASVLQPEPEQPPSQSDSNSEIDSGDVPQLEHVKIGSSRPRAEALLRFQHVKTALPAAYDAAVLQICNSDWDLRQDISHDVITWPQIIPPKSEIVLACSSSHSICSKGFRLWLTYKIVQPGSTPKESHPVVRFEALSQRWTLPFRRSVSMHADVRYQSTQKRKFYVQYNDATIQEKHAEMHFTLCTAHAGEQEQVDVDLAKKNALERMMMQRQEAGLEQTKKQLFTRATTVLFLMYNVLTSNVFGLFACFDTDFGDSYNRLDLQIDCNEWSYKNIWQAAALVFLALYSVGIPFLFAVMLLHNRKVLAKDPSEEMRLEEFANVVSLIDEDASIKEIASMFSDMDEDFGGSVSLTELRIGAVHLGLKVKKAGGVETTQAERVSKDLRYEELSEKRKTDVQVMLGFPPESPALDRIRIESVRIDSQVQLLNMIKQCSDNIQQAVNQCILVAALGPAYTNLLQPDSAFCIMSELKFAPRPLVMWDSMTEQEIARVKALNFDQASWDGQNDDDLGISQDLKTPSLTSVQIKLGLAPNWHLMQGNTRRQAIEGIYGSVTVWFEHVIAELRLRGLSDLSHSMQFNLGTTKSVDLGGMPVICCGDQDTGPLRQDKNTGRETTFGYELIWSSQYTERTQTHSSIDSSSWWVSEHLGTRFRTEPAFVLQHLQRQQSFWEGICEQERRMSRFFGGDEFFDSVKDAKRTAVQDLLMSHQERKIANQADANEQYKTFAQHEAQRQLEHAKVAAADAAQQAHDAADAADRAWEAYQQAADRMAAHVGALEPKERAVAKVTSLDSVVEVEKTELGIVSAATARDAMRRNFTQHRASAVEQATKDQTLAAWLDAPIMEHPFDRDKTAVSTAIEVLRIFDDAESVLTQATAVANEKEKLVDQARKDVENLQVYANSVLETDQRIVWSNRWDARGWLDIFDFTWSDLGKQTSTILSSEDGETPSLQDAFKLAFDVNELTLTSAAESVDEFAENEWDQLRHTMQECRSSTNFVKLMNCSKKRKSAIETAIEEVQSVIEYIVRQEEHIVAEVSRSAAAEETSRQKLLQRQAEELRDELWRLDWKRMEQDDDSKGLQLLACLGYTEYSWTQSIQHDRELTPHLWYFKDWSNLSNELRTALSETKLIPNPAPGSTPYFTEQHWNFLYHTGESDQKREDLRARHKLHRMEFFLNNKEWKDMTSDERSYASKFDYIESGENDECIEWDEHKLTLATLQSWQQLTEEQRHIATMLLAPADTSVSIDTSEVVDPDAVSADADAVPPGDVTADLKARTDKAELAWHWISFGGERQEQRDERDADSQTTEDYRLDKLKATRRAEHLRNAKATLRSLGRGTAENIKGLLGDADIKDDVLFKKLKADVEQVTFDGIDVEGYHLEQLQQYQSLIRRKVERDGNVKLFMLPARRVDQLWNARNVHDINKHNRVFSFRALSAKCLRVVNLNPIFLHRIFRFWSELTTEERQAGIKLGYSQHTWDEQVQTYSPPVFRKVHADASFASSGNDEMMENPAVQWFFQGSILPKALTCNYTSPSLSTICDSLFWPMYDVKQTLSSALEGDRDKYSFLVQAYTPRCFFWEIVEYARKFILSGVLIFVAPGSLSQVFVGAVLSLAYLLLVARLMPYRDPKSNRTKLLAEGTLSFTFLCTLAMRGDLAGEAISAKDYSDIMIITLALGTMVPAVVNLWNAIASYGDTVMKLQQSLQGSAVVDHRNDVGTSQRNRIFTLYQRIASKLETLYKYAVQLTSAFEQLDDVITSGGLDDKMDSSLTLPEDKDLVEDLVEALVTSSDGQLSSGSAGASQTSGQEADQGEEQATIPPVDHDMPDVYYVRADGQIVPKRHRELEQDQIEWLDTLGYARSDSAKWDNEYPPPAQDTTRKEWRHLSKEQKEAAQKLGFTSKTWVSFWIEKQYSSVVLQRKERKEFLEKRISSVQLNSMWAHVESLSWTGDVVFSEDKWFEALVGAWKACELSGIEQALERYSIEYCETFKHHVAAGLQGHDSSDLDWLELSEAQRMGARTLGYDRDTWNSGRLPAVLKDEAGRKRAWNKLNQIEADAAHELDFTEESWNQADTLAVMDSTAITETIRWFTTRAHGSFSISNAKEYESAQECLEMTLLKLASDALAEHESVAEEAAKRSVQDATTDSSGTDLVLECWTKTRASMHATQLMKDQHQQMCESRTAASRLVRRQDDELPAVRAPAQIADIASKELFKAQHREDFVKLAGALVIKELNKDRTGLTQFVGLLKEQLSTHAVKLGLALRDALGRNRDVREAPTANGLAVLETKMMLRAAWEVTVRMALSLQSCAKAKAAANASLQSVIVQSWNDLTTAQQKSLMLLGYDADGKDFDNRRLTETVKKKLQDCTSAVRNAAKFLDLDEENWMDWQEEWQEPVITNEEKRWSELTDEQINAALALGFRQRSWNSGNIPLKFRRPWGSDDVEKNVIVSIGSCSESDETAIAIAHKLAGRWQWTKQESEGLSNGTILLKITSLEAHHLHYVDGAPDAETFEAVIVDSSGKVIFDSQATSPIQVSDIECSDHISIQVKKTNLDLIRRRIQQLTSEIEENTKQLQTLTGGVGSEEVSNPLFEDGTFDTESSVSLAASTPVFETSGDIETGIPKTAQSAEAKGLLDDITSKQTDLNRLRVQEQDLDRTKGWNDNLKWEVCVVVESTKMKSARPVDEELSADDRNAAGQLGYTERSWNAWNLDGADWNTEIHQIHQVQLMRMGYDQSHWAVRNKAATRFDHQTFVTARIKDHFSAEVAVISRDDVSEALKYFQALSDLALLVPVNGQSKFEDVAAYDGTAHLDICNRQLKTTWEPLPEETASQPTVWGDIESSGNKVWQDAAATIKLEEADWEALCKDPKRTLEAKLPVQDASIAMLLQLAQIGDAANRLYIFKAQWIGDVDHVRWQAMHPSQKSAAAILQFDRKSWNRRQHTPITVQEWDKIKRPPSKLFLRSRGAVNDELEYMQHIHQAAQDLWQLDAERAETRWNLLVKESTLQWRDLTQEAKKHAKNVDIDRKKWKFLTQTIQQNALQSIETRHNDPRNREAKDIASFSSLFDATGKDSFRQLLLTVMRTVDVGLNGTVHKLYQQRRVAMENTSVVARKGVARARRSMRDPAEDRLRHEAQLEQRRKAERRALSQLFSQPWSKLSPQQRDGAKQLGYRSDVQRMKNECAEDFSILLGPAPESIMEESYEVDEPQLLPAQQDSAVRIAKRAVELGLAADQQIFKTRALWPDVRLSRAVTAADKAQEDLQQHDSMEQARRGDADQAILATHDKEREALENTHRQQAEQADTRRRELNQLVLTTTKEEREAREMCAAMETCLAWDHHELPWHTGVLDTDTDNDVSAAAERQQIADPTGGHVLPRDSSRVNKIGLHSSIPKPLREQQQNQTPADPAVESTIAVADTPESEEPGLWFNIVAGNPQFGLLSFAVPEDKHLAIRRMRSSIHNVAKKVAKREIPFGDAQRLNARITNYKQRFIVTGSRNEFRFEVDQLLSPKPWRLLTEAHRSALIRNFDINEELWFTLRRVFAAEEVARLQNIRAAFVTHTDERYVDAVAAEMTVTEFCQVVKDALQCPMLEDTQVAPAFDRIKENDWTDDCPPATTRLGGHGAHVNRRKDAHGASTFGVDGGRILGDGVGCDEFIDWLNTEAGWAWRIQITDAVGSSA